MEFISNRRETIDLSRE